MSEYSQYYQAFSARLQKPEGLSPEQCRCNGGGWILSDVDTWHKCPDHYQAGQPHPDDHEQAENEAAFPIEPSPYTLPVSEVSYDDIPF